MSRETYWFKGKRLHVHSPLEDGLALVRQRYPRAIAEGSTAHFSYIINFGSAEEMIVAETWANRYGTAWYLKFREE